MVMRFEKDGLSLDIDTSGADIKQLGGRVVLLDQDQCIFLEFASAVPIDIAFEARRDSNLLVLSLVALVGLLDSLDIDALKLAESIRDDILVSYGIFLDEVAIVRAPLASLERREKKN